MERRKKGEKRNRDNGRAAGRAKQAIREALALVAAQPKPRPEGPRAAR